MSPEISVFIPVFNGAMFLNETIHSLQSQTYRNFVVLCVDDGSTDESLCLLHKVAVKDDRFKIYSKKHEGSVPYSWNFIINDIETPWVLYMSQDDYLHKDLLKDLISQQKVTRADAVIPSCRFFRTDIKSDEFKSLNDKNDMTTYFKSGTISGKRAFELMFDYTIPGFALWKTIVVKRLGMPVEAFNSDEGMQRIWILNSDKVAFVSTPFYYRLREGSIGSGIKYHHYFSVLTEMKLLKTAKQIAISSKKIHKVQYKSLFWTIWLQSHIRVHKNGYSRSQLQEIKKVLAQAYSFFRSDIDAPFTPKEYVLFCVTRHSLFCRLFVFFYSLYLRLRKI